MCLGSPYDDENCQANNSNCIDCNNFAEFEINVPEEASEGKHSLNIKLYSGDKIGIARKLVGTLFDSIKGIPNVEICGNVWASNSSGDIGITEIKNIQDVQKISLHMNYELTPTHMGLEYSMQMLKRMKGYNKLIILITDGYPNYHKNNKDVPTHHYLKTCRRSLQKVLKVTPNVLCFNVESGLHAKTLNQKLFGKKRVITVYDMQDASGKIIKEFRKFIVKNVENPF